MPRTYDRKTPTPSRPYSETVAKCKELMATGSSLRETANICEKKFGVILRMKRAEKWSRFRVNQGHFLFNVKRN